MARPRTKATNAKINKQCVSCGSVFTGLKCPECGETTEILELSKDGIPITDIQSAIGKQPESRITLGYDTELIDPEEEMRRLAASEHRQIVTDMMLDKAKARQADEEAKMIRAQQELELTKRGFTDSKKSASSDESGESTRPPQPINLAPGMLIRELGSWEPEAREEFLETLSAKPELASVLSMITNPQAPTGYGQMNPAMMGQMNPMMMGGMMPQQPVEQAPQPSAADMMTSMIMGLQKMQEISNANAPKDNGLDRVLDKLEKLEERNKDLEMKIVEMGSQPSGIDMDAVRNMVRDAQESARGGQDDMLGSFQQISGFINQMEELGLVRSRGESDRESFEERKWKAEFDLKKQQLTTDTEMEKLAGEQEIAKQNASAGVLQTVLGMAMAPHTDDDDGTEPEDKKSTEHKRATVLT